MIENHCANIRYIKWDSFIFLHDLDDRLFCHMPYGQFIEYVGIAFCQICDNQVIINNSLYDLACDDAGIANLICACSRVTTFLDSGLNDVRQDLIGAPSGI